MLKSCLLKSKTLYRIEATQSVKQGTRFKQVRRLNKHNLTLTGCPWKHYLSSYPFYSCVVIPYGTLIFTSRAHSETYILYLDTIHNV